ncbi:hypothetical protein ACIQCX_16730 [Enterobacter cancerogenus]|uniref:hypothetical protein n=1 Tax=Enterobacter cancerogenus TaxID=69218 RepID=UPI0037F97F6E
MGIGEIGVISKGQLIKEGIISLLCCSCRLLWRFCCICGSNGQETACQSETSDDQIDIHPQPLSVYTVSFVGVMDPGRKCFKRCKKGGKINYNAVDIFSKLMEEKYKVRRVP